MDMISVDKARCTKCGSCIRLMDGYCITEDGGYPVFDKTVCNVCQKCVSVCPSQAIMVNDLYPEKITEEQPVSADMFTKLIERRRSIKHFKNEPIAREILTKIVAVANYGPNQNKNISIVVIDDPKVISEIDQYALSFVARWYKLMFGSRITEDIIRLFYRDIHIIKKKMELDVLRRKRIVKLNTQALIILTGNKRIAVTEASAHYVMATMMNMAEILSVGNTLMDSLLLTLNGRKQLRKKLGITDDVLGVLCLGYSSERVVNIPRGYEMDVRWI